MILIPKTEAVVAPTRRESPEDLAKRGVLAHMEHLRALGEALIKAVNTYIAAHQASEATSDWRDDFASNVAEATREFHRSLSASSKAVVDTYFGDGGSGTASDTGVTRP
jgi:hypothetical protein